MQIQGERGEVVKARWRKVALGVCTSAALALTLGQTIRGADESNPSPMFKQYCFQCHGKTSPMAGISIEQLASQSSISDGYQQWERVAAALEQNRMPPKGMPQPSEPQRREAAAWIRAALSALARKK